MAKASTDEFDEKDAQKRFEAALRGCVALAAQAAKGKAEGEESVQEGEECPKILGMRCKSKSGAGELPQKPKPARSNSSG
jgi:hypothetical protein